MSIVLVQVGLVCRWMDRKSIAWASISRVSTAAEPIQRADVVGFDIVRDLKVALSSNTIINTHNSDLLAGIPSTSLRLGLSRAR